MGGATGAIIGGVLGGGRGAAIGAIIGGATGAAIGAEGELRPGGYRYYQDACYQQQPDGAWLAVSPEYCAPAPAYAQDNVGIAVDIAPPPLPVYDQPPIPAPGYIWTPGYWAWDDDTGYYWVPGTWVLPPEPALLWTPGYWGWNDGVYAFHEGYWGPEVGFYGGVSYGYGYTGDGYEGGYWRGGAFFYNRTVNNISNVQISNVYNKTVVVNNVDQRELQWRRRRYDSAGDATANCRRQSAARAADAATNAAHANGGERSGAVAQQQSRPSHRCGDHARGATERCRRRRRASGYAGCRDCAARPQRQRPAAPRPATRRRVKVQKPVPAIPRPFRVITRFPACSRRAPRAQKLPPEPTPRRFPAITRFLACSHRAPRVPAPPVRKPAPATLRLSRAIMRFPVCSSMAGACTSWRRNAVKARLRRSSNTVLDKSPPVGAA